jgi:hypothetical protein
VALRLWDAASLRGRESILAPPFVVRRPVISCFNAVDIGFYVIQITPADGFLPAQAGHAPQLIGFGV